MTGLWGGQGVDTEVVGVWSYTVRFPTLVLLAMKPWTWPSPRVEPPAQLHQWPSLPPCLTDLAHSMLLDYVWNLPRVFLPWLCFFSLFLCFLFFLTHYVATFPSCVLCVLCLCFSFIFTLSWAPSSPSLFAASPCPLPVSLGHLILPQPSCHLQAGAVWWSRA